MTIANLLRSATLALPLVAAAVAMTGPAFAAPRYAAPQQWQQDEQGQQAPSAAPYDSPDFTVPFNEVY